MFSMSSSGQLRPSETVACQPKISGPSHGHNHAPDLAKGKSWYSKILAIQPYFDQPFYVGFSVGGYELGLDPDPSSSAGSCGVVVYWGVSDADAALKRLVSLGVG